MFARHKCRKNKYTFDELTPEQARRFYNRDTLLGSASPRATKFRYLLAPLPSPETVLGPTAPNDGSQDRLLEQLMAGQSSFDLSHANLYAYTL